MDLLDGLEVVVHGSQLLVTWALMIVAGSIAAIISTSYIRPNNDKVRLIYLLFIKGLDMSEFVSERLILPISTTESQKFIEFEFLLTITQGMFILMGGPIPFGCDVTKRKNKAFRYNHMEGILVGLP